MRSFARVVLARICFEGLYRADQRTRSKQRDCFRWFLSIGAGELFTAALISTMAHWRARIAGQGLVSHLVACTTEELSMRPPVLGVLLNCGFT